MLSLEMKNIYTLILENTNGEFRKVEVAGNSLIHAMERAERFGEMETSDKLKDYSCTSTEV